MASESSLIFISGGVRSGKSSFAEKLAAELARQDGGKLHYIAAGQSSDSEMRERIARHQKDRLKSGLNWKTWERPIGLAQLSETFTNQDIVLLDCLTTLLNNEFFALNEDWENPFFQKQVMLSILEGIEKIVESCHVLIVVSNEVLHDSIKDHALVYTYGKLLGKLHQQMAARSEYAYLIEAGIPLRMKGAE